MVTYGRRQRCWLLMLTLNSMSDVLVALVLNATSEASYEMLLLLMVMRRLLLLHAVLMMVRQQRWREVSAADTGAAAAAAGYRRRCVGRRWRLVLQQDLGSFVELLAFHASVLEPDFYLTLGQVQFTRDLPALLASNVRIADELVL